MDAKELFEEVKASLEEHKMEFLTDADKNTFQLVISGESGQWQTRLVCEAEPLCLQVYCRLPLKIAGEQKNEVALALHKINLGIRFGSYYFNPENGVVGLQVPGVISEGGEVQPQIGAWISTAVSTFDENLRSLTLVAGATRKARQKVRKLAPKSDGPVEERGLSLPKSRRPELN